VIRLGRATVALGVLWTGLLPSPRGGAAPDPPPVESVTDLGTLGQNAGIKGRDGGWSALWAGRSMWTFGDTVLAVPGEENDYWADNTLSSTTDLTAADGVTLEHDHLDGTGAPTEAIPLTRREARYNALHQGDNCEVEPCNAEFALWGGPVVPDPAGNRVLLWYAKIHRIIGEPGWTSIGSGIAVWEPGTKVIRPILSPGSPDPTLLFFAGEGPLFDSGSLLVDDIVHSYGCLPGFLIQKCRLARVPLADILERSAWEFYAGNGVWSPDLSDAVVVFQAGAANSVFWDGYLGLYVNIYSQVLSNDVMYRVAESPEGPWSGDALLFRGMPGEPGTINYFALSHPEYAEGDGRTHYVTYVRATGFFEWEFRLVQVVFGGGSTG
jgi:hypothetical protein